MKIWHWLAGALMLAGLVVVGAKFDSYGSDLEEASAQLRQSRICLDSMARTLEGMRAENTRFMQSLQSLQNQVEVSYLENEKRYQQRQAEKQALQVRIDSLRQVVLSDTLPAAAIGVRE